MAKRLRPAELADPPELIGPVPSVTLANGVEIPSVGLGTAFFYGGLARPDKAWPIVAAALDAGYRHIDGANMYGCERQVGAVLGSYFMQGKLTREDIFVTTKVGHPPTTDFLGAKTQYLYDPELSAYEGALQEFYECLNNLGTGYVDLVLLHWPGMFDFPDRFPEGWIVPMVSKELARRKRAEMWAALEHVYERKLARAIGVSNYMKEHLEHLLPTCKVTPMMNQFEVHPYLAQREFVDYCQGHNIQVTAYSPLAAGKTSVMQDETVLQLAEKKGVTPGQVVLSWLVQRGIVVIPKSSNPGRLAENLSVSDKLLTYDEMQLMLGLDRGLHTCPDPSSIP